MKPIKFESEVIESKELTPSVKNIKLYVTDEFTFTAGQHVQVRIDTEEESLKNPYSITSSPYEKGYIELCVKKIEDGKMSTALCNLKERDKVKILGPLGKFSIEDDSKDFCFISTGAGIAPLRSMIKTLITDNNKNKIILFSGYKTEKDMLYHDEFLDMDKNVDNFEYHVVVSREKKYEGEHGHVQELIEKFLPEDFEGNFYICGLNNMIVSVKEQLEKIGIEKSRIHFERYD